LAKTLYVTFKRQIPQQFLQSTLSPFLYTGHNTPSVQLLGSISLVQACWTTSCNPSTRLGPPFFNSSAAVESTSAALLFLRYFSAPSIYSRLGKSMSFLSSLKSTGRIVCSDSEPLFKFFSKWSSHLASTWFLLVNSSPFLAQHIATCGSNSRLTSFRRL
jgi:hypothetical protein